jgi:hypothetical protein
MLTISKSSFSNLPESTHVHSALALSIDASDKALTEAIARADRHAMRPMPCDRASRGNLRWTVVGFSAMAIIGFAMNSVVSLRAAPSQSELMAQSELGSQANKVDRSRKGDRITPVAPVIRAALPPGCDAPFSSLAKFSPPNFAGRCLT